MRIVKVAAGALLILVPLLKTLLDIWGALDGLITKLRSKGSVGNFMADILVSRITLLLLVLAGLVLLWTAIKELRAHNQKNKGEFEDDLLNEHERPGPHRARAADVDIRIHNAVSQSQIQAQAQEQAQAEVERQPPVVILPRSAFMETVKADNSTGEIANLYRTRNAEGDNRLMNVRGVFAKFYRDDNSPEPFVDVKANIEFFRNENQSIFRVDNAYWWQAEGQHVLDATFRHGSTNKLIVAVIDQGDVFPYAGRYISIGRIGLSNVFEFVMETAGMPLSDKEYIVQIELIGTRGGQRKVRKTCKYDLTVEAGSFQLRDCEDV